MSAAINGDDDWAVHEAVRRWVESERPLSDRIRQTREINAALFSQWLTYWGVARSSPIGAREPLRLFLNSVALPALKGAAPTDHQVVPAFSKEIVDRGLMEHRPTSLISKLAFSCQPEVFVPYDSRGRKALKRLGHKVRDHDYAAYMVAFATERARISAELALKDISPASVTHEGEALPPSLFWTRVADKRLMLVGGFRR